MTLPAPPSRCIIPPFLLPPLPVFNSPTRGRMWQVWGGVPSMHRGPAPAREQCVGRGLRGCGQISADPRLLRAAPRLWRRPGSTGLCRDPSSRGRRCSELARRPQCFPLTVPASVCPRLNSRSSRRSIAPLASGTPRGEHSAQV